MTLRTRRALACAVLSVVCASGPLGSCAVVGALVLAPFQLAASGPAPTLAAAESEELAQRVSGTLVVADHSGSITLIDLPTRQTRRVEAGDRVLAATVPDESGRIANLREYYSPLQRLSGALFGAGKPRTVLALRALDGDVEQILGEVRSNRPRRSIQLSQRGGRVLAFEAPQLADVFDIQSGARLERAPLHAPRGAPWLDANGRCLAYPRRQRAQAVEQSRVRLAAAPTRQRRSRRPADERSRSAPLHGSSSRLRAAPQFTNGIVRPSLRLNCAPPAAGSR